MVFNDNTSFNSQLLNFFITLESFSTASFFFKAFTKVFNTDRQTDRQTETDR